MPTYIAIKQPIQTSARNETTLALGHKSKFHIIPEN